MFYWCKLEEKGNRRNTHDRSAGRMYCRPCGRRQFSKAAEKLFISQPAISQNIKRMEQQYGVKIFDRSTKTMHLTEAGSAIYQAAKRCRELSGK